MILIPINDEERKLTAIVVIFDKHNLERMEAGDPITLESIKRGGALRIDYPDNCTLMIAYEYDLTEIINLAEKGDLAGVLKIVQRGFEFRAGEDGNENITELSGRAWH